MFCFQIIMSLTSTLVLEKIIKMVCPALSNNFATNVLHARPISLGASVMLLTNIACDQPTIYNGPS